MPQGCGSAHPLRRWSRHRWKRRWVTQGDESIGQKEIEKLKEEEGTVQEQVY